jgi:hypothetical protein
MMPLAPHNNDLLLANAAFLPVENLKDIRDTTDTWANASLDRAGLADGLGANLTYTDFYCPGWLGKELE